MKEQPTAENQSDTVIAPPPATPVPKKSPGKTIVLFVGVFVTALLGAVLGVWVMQQGVAQPLNRGSGVDGNTTKLQNEQNIESVAKKVGPSVVSIFTNVQSQMASGQAAGTGVIISANGYVMTNKHVVASASSITVATAGGDIYERVKLIGSDPLNDLAFLKIDNVNNLTAAEIGESSTLRIGQNVVAVGNSLGEYQNTVTSGIISGLGRPVSAQGEDGRQESLTDLVQTDTAINPGNSGGPLVNMSGQVVGINTAVASDAQGIGFAIPIDATKGIMEGVLKKGVIERPYIGVRYTDISPALAKERKLSVKSGALVAGSTGNEAIEAGSPAEKAGLKEGDIITKIGNLTVGQNGSVSSLVSAYKPGDTVKVTYLRGGKENSVDVKLATYTPPAETMDRSPLRQRRQIELPFGF